MKNELIKKSLIVVRLGVVALIIWQMSAVHFSVDSNIESMTEVKHDTSLTFCSSDIHIDFKAVTEDFVDIDDFIAFGNGYCNLPLMYEKEERIDTTGDGNPETVRSTVELIAGGCRVHNTIIKNGKVIWDDEMLIDDDRGAYLFGGKANYDRFYPLSAFYLGVVNVPFYDELHKGQKDYNFRKNFLLDHLADTHDAGKLENARNSYLSEYMDNYKGKYIFSLNMASRDIFIWDDFKKAFVPLYLS